MNESVDVAVDEEAAGQVVTAINRNSKPYTDCRLVCVCVSIERELERNVGGPFAVLIKLCTSRHRRTNTTIKMQKKNEHFKTNGKHFYVEK